AIEFGLSEPSNMGRNHHQQSLPEIDHSVEYYNGEENERLQNESQSFAGVGYGNENGNGNGSVNGNRNNSNSYSSFASSSSPSSGSLPSSGRGLIIERGEGSSSRSH